MLDVHAFLMNAAEECFRESYRFHGNASEEFDWDKWIELMIPRIDQANHETNSDFDSSVVALYIWACFCVANGVNADASVIRGHRRRD